MNLELDFYETPPVALPEGETPPQTNNVPTETQTPTTEQPETPQAQVNAPAAPQPPQAPRNTVFIGDSHTEQLARFSGLNAPHTGVNGARIDGVFEQLKQVPRGSRVFMSVGTNDAVDDGFSDVLTRRTVARMVQHAKDNDLDVTWIGPLGPKTKRFNAMAAETTANTNIKFKSMEGVAMKMQPDGYHALIDDKGYGAMWRSLSASTPPQQQQTSVPDNVPAENIMQLGPVDMKRIYKLVLTEAVHGLSKEAYAQQVGGIIDTALNRVRSGHWGKDLLSVLNAPSQFSDINGRPAWQKGRNHVDQIPDSWLNTPNGRKVIAAVDAHITHRMNNTSLIGGNLNYANPHYSDKVNLSWISKLDGPRLGEGTAIHWHGTAFGKTPVNPNYFLRVVGTQLQQQPQAQPNPDIDFAPPTQERDVNAAPPAAPEITRMNATRTAVERYENSSYWQILKDTWSQDTLTGRIIANVGEQRFSADPSFLLTPDLQSKLQKEFNLSNDAMSSLTNAVSLNHAQYLAGLAKQAEERDALMASYGWTGLATRVGTAIFADPVALAAGIATGGIADLAVVGVQGARIARVAAQAIAGAGTNVGIDLAMRELGDPHAGKNLALTATAGAIFGASYGILSRNPATVDEARMLQNAAASLNKTLKAAAPDAPSLPAPAGAAHNPNANIPALNDAVINALTQDSAPKTAMSSLKVFGYEIPLRWSAVGQLGRTKDPLARIGSTLAEDGVGKHGHALNPFSRSEEAMKLYDSMRSDLYNTWGPSVEKWATDQGIGVGARVRAASDFNRLVHQAVVDRNPNYNYHVEVLRVANKISALNAEILKLSKNPFHREQLIGRAVKGFEEVPQNPNYMMRVYDDAKINAVREKFGDTGLQTLFRGAIKSARPDMEDDLIETIARHFVTRITRRANGVDDDFARLVNGDSDVLAAILRDVDVPEDQLSTIMARWDRHKVSTQQGVDNRAKHRLLMDETYVVRNYPTSPEWRAKNPGVPAADLTLKDLVLDDAIELSERYFRHMSGRISMAKWRPTDAKTGDLLLDGITSDAEFTNFLARVRESGNKHGLTKSEIAKNVENLEFLYHRTLGRPDPAQMTGWANFFRRVRAVEHMRLGMNLGIAQLPEFIMPVAQIGLKATMSHAPALRRIVNMDGEEVLRSGLGRELEAALGRAHLSSGSYLRDEAAGGIATGVGGKVDNALTLGVNAVNEASGMGVVNRTLVTMTRNAIAQKFADMALDATKANMERMASLGLSKPMLDRVLKQLRDDRFVKREDGMFGKLTELNMHRWEDQEARSHFENALWRWSRRTIQQNDAGQLHRWFSHPFWQMLLQFRAFPLVAWEKQMLHNLHIRDMHAFNTLWMSMATGTAVYAAYTNVQALGRNDKNEFLEKRLAIGQLVAGGWQRAGWSSILPIIADTGTAITGIDPIFNARTTGQPMNILGFPAMSHLDDISKAMRGIVQPHAEDRPRSQQEYQSITRAVTTWWPIANLMGVLTSDAPAKAPKNQ